jgi:hypothetical protein
MHVVFANAVRTIMDAYGVGPVVGGWTVVGAVAGLVTADDRMEGASIGALCGLAFGALCVVAA